MAMLKEAAKLLKGKKTNIQFSFYLEKINYDIGENVSGKVALKIDNSLQIAGIRVRMLATETVFATDSHDTPENKKNKSKMFIDSSFTNILTGKHTIQPGDNFYDFTLRIPEGSPPSIQIPNVVEIKYELYGEIVFASGSPPLAAKKVFYVSRVTPKELPASFVEKKDKGIMSKESMTLRCTTDKLLYDNGDTISMDVVITNHSKKQFVRFLVGVERSVKYGKKNEEQVILQTDVTKPKLPIDGGAKFEDTITLELPHGLVASVGKSNLVKTLISYFVVCKCELESGSELVFKVPINIRSRHVSDISTENEVSSSPAIARRGDSLNRSTGGAPSSPQTSEFAHDALDLVPPPVNRDTRPGFQVPPTIPALPSRIAAPASPSISRSNVPMPYGHPSFFGALTFYKPVSSHHGGHDHFPEIRPAPVAH